MRHDRVRDNLVDQLLRAAVDNGPNPCDRLMTFSRDTVVMLMRMAWDAGVDARERRTADEERERLHGPETI